MPGINISKKLIETDLFPVEFLSRLAERESWRKEIHRPVYHVHKWWAKRLGSVFRGILLGCILNDDEDLPTEFYKIRSPLDITVLDPFMGSGTTIGEAHKLGLIALGRDINAVAAESVRVALGPLDKSKLLNAFAELSQTTGRKIRGLYGTKDSAGRACEVLYYFWVMRSTCPNCVRPVDLFPSWVLAKNAYPYRKPRVQIHCPACGAIFSGVNGQKTATCPACRFKFSLLKGNVKRAIAICKHCGSEFRVIDGIGASENRPDFRLYAKLVINGAGEKEYLPATVEDYAAYDSCSAMLRDEETAGNIILPSLRLEHGVNTSQAINYGFTSWRSFFNDRQLLALGWLQEGINEVQDEPAKCALLTLFSGVLEFNNMFASYKGEGTGAVRHLFSHHILKPERIPIEANVWGTPKSSGSFSNLFRSRLLRAIDYRSAPTEIQEEAGKKPLVCAPPFSGDVAPQWPVNGAFDRKAIYLSCGDSAHTDLPERSIDLVVTDPPFFDNVHYSELADFFFAWQELLPRGFVNKNGTTRDPKEVQDPDAKKFGEKLTAVFKECYRVLKDDGLIVFTYHHSRDEGWESLARAISDAGLVVINAHPIKSEMSIATPKSQAKNPIVFDVVIVCRKAGAVATPDLPSPNAVKKSALMKIKRLEEAGFLLSNNDRKIILRGQALTAVHPGDRTQNFFSWING